jgi:hypothetical protein
MESLPVLLTILFLGTTALTFYFVYKASPSTRWVWIAIVWLVLHSLLAVNDFYLPNTGFPPRLFLFLVGPALLGIIILFNTSSGKIWIDSLDEKWLTYLHSVRIPVELVLYGLFLNGLIPDVMTFEGRNPDILSGITAIAVGYWGYTSKRSRLSKKVILGWNIICMILLINIVSIAIVSAPLPFQQLAFEQPNRAIFYFPFVLLPGFIVPAVLFAHLAAIRKRIR